jgi:hypothetical protein
MSKLITNQQVKFASSDLEFLSNLVHCSCIDGQEVVSNQSADQEETRKDDHHVHNCTLGRFGNQGFIQSGREVCMRESLLENKDNNSQSQLIKLIND